MTRTLTTRTFKAAVIDSGATALIDFHADWCAPCRAQGPIVDALAESLGERAIVAKVDVEAEPALAELLQIRALPTLVLFRDGRIARRFTGLTDRDTLAAALGA
jgi:thioredoxin 1